MPDPETPFVPDPPPRTTSASVTFGAFRYDHADRTLWRDGDQVHLPPRVLAVLEYLIDRPGLVVPKQALLDAAWRDAHVSESSLTEAIGQLRQALGDSTQEPVFIRTVHRRGYRFIAPVGGAVPTSAPALAPSAAGRRVEARRAATGLRAKVVVAVLLTAGAGFAAWRVLATSPPPAVTRTTISLPPNQSPAPGLTASPVAALSPDGTRLVYVAGPTSDYQLYERALDQFEAVPIPGTAGAHGVFFSPDGGAIGYFVEGSVYTMDLGTRESVRRAESGASLGGSWLGDHALVVATGDARGLLRIGLDDGQVSRLPVDETRAYRLRFPQALPDGRTIVATELRGPPRESVIVRVDAVTGAVQELGPGNYARWTPPGWLTFLRDDVLMARPFPAAGEAMPALDGVMTSLTGAGQYALSATGSLLYIPTDPARRRRQLVRVVDGRLEDLPFEPMEYQSVTVSPDGRRIAATVFSDGAADLWIGDIARGTLSRIAREGLSLDPVWSADGRWVIFGWMRQGQLDVYRVAADGEAPPRPDIEHADASPLSLAPDGTLLAQRRDPTQGLDLLVFRPGQARPDVWLATPASETLARFSPDGRWVAFQSNRSGRRQIYLRSFADASFGERQVSTSGGADPHWIEQGRAILYTNGDRAYRVPVAEDGTLGLPAILVQDVSLFMARPGPGASLVGIRRLQEERPITTLRFVNGWLREVAGRFAR